MSAFGDDCHFFYNSSSSCKKGNRCPFRHSEPALSCFATCRFWKNGRRCTKPNCNYRHSNVNLGQKKRELIPCYHENQPTGCNRPDCQFKHLKPRPYLEQTFSESTSTHAMVHFQESSSDYIAQSSSSSSSSDSEYTLSRGSNFRELPMSPGTPIAVTCTSNSIMLSWEEPPTGMSTFLSYKVAYREYDQKTEWKYTVTGSRKPIFTVRNLKAETSYEFKIGTFSEESDDGPFSKAVTFSTSTILRSGNPKVYKIPLQTSKESTNIAAKTRKCSFVNTDDEYDIDDDIPLSQLCKIGLASGVNVDDYATIDNNVSTSSLMTDDGILDEIIASRNVSEAVQGVEEEEPVKRKPSSVAVLSAIDVITEHLEFLHNSNSAMQKFNQVSNFIMKEHLVDMCKITK